MQTKKNSPEQNQFFTAIKQGQLQTVEQMAQDCPALLTALDYGEFGGTCLNLVAGHRANFEMVRLLVKLGADINQKSDWWAGPWSPAMLAHYYFDNGICEYLIDQGAELDVHLAAGICDTRTLAHLLNNDPKLIHARGGDGCMPLHFAGSIKTVDFLLERGANLEARDIDHFSTPVQWAAGRNIEVAQHLFQRGAKPDIFSAVLAGDALVTQTLIDQDATVLNWRINQDYFPPGKHPDVHNIMSFTVGMEGTPLHAAASGNQDHMIPILVAAGMDVNACGAYDESTALHSAAWNNHVKVAKALIEHGADIEQRSGKIHQNTPLGWAIVAGSSDMVELLIESGCQQHDYYLSDAKAGLKGAFKEYKWVDPKEFQRIMHLLEKDSTE